MVGRERDVGGREDAGDGRDTAGRDILGNASDEKNARTSAFFETKDYRSIRYYSKRIGRDVLAWRGEKQDS